MPPDDDDDHDTVDTLRGVLVLRLVMARDHDSRFPGRAAPPLAAGGGLPVENLKSDLSA